jgi:RNA recognition motif-containing protein
MISEGINEWTSEGVDANDHRTDALAAWRSAADETKASPMSKLTASFSHSRVPRNVNLAEAFALTAKEVPITTLMIRNIPNRYTQNEVARELDSLGLEGLYDFLYVPIDKATKSNVGYAFVNFLKEDHAQTCFHIIDGYTFKKHRKARGKIASVAIAHLQGLEANLRHYENSAVGCGQVNTTPVFRRRGGAVSGIPWCKASR